MSGRQGRAVGGSCFGGVAGLVLGILIGGFLGSGSQSNLPKEGPVDPKPIDACVGFIGMALGAGIGGLVGALGGLAVGAAIATRAQNDASATRADQRLEQARLKAKVAELEEKTRNSDPPASSEDSQGFRAEPGPQQTGHANDGSPRRSAYPREPAAELGVRHGRGVVRFL